MARASRVTRPTPPGAALGIATLVVSGYAWWLAMTSDPSDDLTRSFGTQIVVFALATVIAMTWRVAVPSTPGRGRERRRDGTKTTNEDGDKGDDATMPFPPRGLWLLPVAETVLFAPTLPVAFAHDPGDASVIGLLPVFTLVMGWLGIGLAFAGWFLVLAPLFGLVRPLGLLALRRRVKMKDLGISVACLTWFAFVGAIAGGVIGEDAPGNRGNWSQIAVLFGIGEPDDPGWVWFGRGCLVVLALCVGFGAIMVARARPRPDRGTGDAVPDPAMPSP